MNVQADLNHLLVHTSKGTFSEIAVHVCRYSQGPVFKNLTKLVANVMIKFLFGNMANMLIFFAKKM